MGSTNRHPLISLDEVDCWLASSGACVLPMDFGGRRPSREAVEEIWRFWPDLCEERRIEVRDLLRRSGVTARLISSVTARNRRKRKSAMQRLLALSDGHSVMPLLAQWQQLDPHERNIVLSLAVRSDYPGLAGFLWRTAAAGAKDPPGEMAALARRIGPCLIDQLGQALSDRESSQWAWQTLLRITGERAERYLVACLGRADELGERAKMHYSSAPAGEVLPLLMRTARFHPLWDVRVGAVAALLRRKEPQALRFLTELLRDRNWYKGQPDREQTPWPVLFGLAPAGESPDPSSAAINQYFG